MLCMLAFEKRSVCTVLLYDSNRVLGMFSSCYYYPRFLYNLAFLTCYYYPRFRALVVLDCGNWLDIWKRIPVGKKWKDYFRGGYNLLMWKLELCTPRTRRILDVFARVSELVLLYYRYYMCLGPSIFFNSGECFWIFVATTPMLRFYPAVETVSCFVQSTHANDAVILSCKGCTSQTNTKTNTNENEKSRLKAAICLSWGKIPMWRE